MSHRGMFRRKTGGGLVCGAPPPGFRYMNDEISNGVISLSQLACESTYNCEPVVNVGDPIIDRIEYPLTNGQLDLSTITTDWPTTTGLRFYNQLNFGAGFEGGNPSGWTGTGMAAGGNYIPSMPTIPNTSPISFVFVLTDMDADLGVNYQLMTSSNNIRLQYSSDTLYFQLNGGTFTRKEYTGTRVSGTKLMIATYDGSQSRSGLNLYINDMATPVTGVDGGNSSTVSAANFISMGFNSVDTLKQEMFVFASELSQSEREVIKEIFEQRYTFS